jgi:hypothetical protein
MTEKVCFAIDINNVDIEIHETAKRYKKFDLH